jgi:ankyrin repeat protein
LSQDLAALSWYDHILLRLAPKDLFFKAMKAHDMEALTRSIKAININAGDIINGMTVLHHAVLSQSPQAINIILAAGADINVRDKDEYTPLHHAALKGDFALVRLLVDNGADAKASTLGGITPFNQAKYKGYLEICDFLQAHGAYNLLEAARCGDLQSVIQFFPDQKNIKTPGGNTPLHLAAMFGHKQVIEFLLQNNIDVNACDDANWMPIHCAITHRKPNRSDIVELLIKHGANVTFVDPKTGWNLLHFAILWRDLPTIKILVTNGVSLNETNKEQKSTPLALAIEFKFFDQEKMEEIINYLRSVGGIT